MPEHNPEDRVRIRNIVAPEQDDVQTLFVERLRKEQKLNANGQVVTVEVPYQQEVNWNFKDGFVFFWGSKPYLLKRGEERTYPRFIADHCAKQQVQYLLNEMHASSKRVGLDGVSVYDGNILRNQSLKKQLRDKIVVGVEEWYEGNEEDFDALMNRQFGGDFNSHVGEGKVDKDDFEIKVPDDEDKPFELKKGTGKKSGDPEVNALRQECDVLAIEWLEGETAAQLKAKITKIMG